MPQVYKHLLILQCNNMPQVYKHLLICERVSAAPVVKQVQILSGGTCECQVQNLDLDKSHFLNVKTKFSQSS